MMFDNTMLEGSDIDSDSDDSDSDTDEDDDSETRDISFIL